MMSGSSTSKTTVPEWQNRAAQEALAAANRVANIKFTPYYGADVAAMTPMQVAALQGTNQAASAFGVPTTDPMAGMPPAQNFNGMMAYSSGNMYDQALAELQRRNPEQFAALTARLTPESEQGGGGVGGGNDRNNRNSRNRGNGAGVLGLNGDTSRDARNTGAGFTSLRDMIDGGGAGRSGGAFSGGPLSGTLNTMGVRPLRSNAAVVTPKPVAKAATKPSSSVGTPPRARPPNLKRIVERPPSGRI